MTFQESCDVLDTLGIMYNRAYEYRTDLSVDPIRDKHDVNIFTNVNLSFSYQEWCEVCMREGDQYMGGCCGNMSAAQDIMNGIFRDGGWADCKDIEEIASLMATHEDDGVASLSFTKLEEPENIITHWDAYTPWDKLACIWHLVKDYYDPKRPVGCGPHMDPMREAVSILSSSFRRLSWKNFIKDESPNANANQKRANHALMMVKLYPALKMFNDHIGELDFGVFDGYALIDKQAGPDKLASNGYGYCIYASQEEVDAIMEQWRRNDKEYIDEGKRYNKPIDDRIEVRRVRITKEKGLEFV